MNKNQNESTKDLQTQLEKLKSELSVISNEFANLNQSFSQKRSEIKKAENEIIELRSGYDRKINTGEGKAADNILPEIKTARQKLKVLIGDITKGCQPDTLKQRGENLKNDVSVLYFKTRDNWELAQKIMYQASALSTAIEPSFRHNLKEIEQLTNEAKKLSDEIFNWE
jgi:hypothetical protein